MERENNIAFVTDSGIIEAKSPEAANLNVAVVPLEVKFWEGGKYVPYSDEFVSTEDFYLRMQSSKKLPETTGALPGRFVEIFGDLRKKAATIISINTTSKESGVYRSALDARDRTLDEDGLPVDIRIIDSKLVAVAGWFPIEAGVNTFRKGGTVKEIEDEVAEVIKKTQLYVTLETFDNLLHGGRAREAVLAFFAATFSKYPVLGFVEGKLKTFTTGESVQNARDLMFQMVGDSGTLAKLAILHTNVPFLARKTRETLKSIFDGNIPIYNIKGALAVHAGVGALALAFQKA